MERSREEIPRFAEGGKGLTIGQVARAAGVGVETVRFYERKGLIEQPEKPMFGRRTYPPETVARIRFIRRAKELGFTLKEIAELLELRMDPGKSCAEVRDRALAKMADIDRKIEALGRMRRALAGLASACRGRGPTTDCPILEAMEEGEHDP
ncbi:MAG: MerR family DNA-binding protein [Deltaproteobacteria bacterium]|nr:MerR family DNA-binding protein [Deltaproteobacteria bacterium]